MEPSGQVPRRFPRVLLSLLVVVGVAVSATSAAASGSNGPSKTRVAATLVRPSAHSRILLTARSVQAAATATSAETTGGATNTWTNYTNAGGTQGPTIPAFTTVQITCTLTGFKVADGNTWWYQIAASPWNNAYYASADAFYNNGATSGSLLGTPFVDPAVPNCGSIQSGTNETTGGVAHTWTDYTDAGGTQGPSIAAYQTVQIACALTGFQVADGNTWWYRIGSAPWSNAYYVSADAFYNNGATSGSLLGTPFVDPAVPLCSGSGGGGGGGGGGPPPTGETSGGVAHTWTNYLNAGGTQGPSVAAFQTVSIACKLTGFTVADGNTWWYLIASAPWSNAYYVSADAFYNNGATSGSLIGTPFVDPAVPDCSTGAKPDDETTGGVANTWANYTHAGGAQGPSIPANDTVQINCRVNGFAVADGNTWWYLVASSPWNSVYYVSADAFYNNGATSGSLTGTPFVDPTIPVCVDNIEAPIYATAIGSSSAAVNSTSCIRVDPIDCASGNFSDAFTDVSVKGRGPGLDLTRTYNDLNVQASGLFGVGWTSTYDQHLTLNADGSITVTLPDGSQFLATPDGSGGFNVPTWADTTLRPASGGTYTLTRRSTELLTFSATGQLLSLRDLNGYQTTLQYNSSNQLASVTDAAGRILKVNVGTNGFVSSVVDPLGRTTTYGYNAAGDLTSVSDPLGRSWGFSYDAGGRMLTSTDPRGGVLTNTYDSQGRVTAQTDPAGLMTTFAYSGDNFGSLGGTTTITDPRGIVEVERYANGFLMQAIKASGTSSQATTSYGYDPATFGVASITDPNGNTTTHTYNAAGQVLTTTDPLGNKTTNTYNALGELLTTTTPLGEVTTRTYDANGNLLSVTGPLGNAVTYAYGDSAHPGDVTSVTDAAGRIRTATYDAYGDVASTTVSPSSGTTDTTKFVYDTDGEQVCKASPNETAAGVTCPAAGGARVAKTTTTVYDADGEVVSVTDPNAHPTSYGYDADGNRAKLTDASGNSTTFAYDADDRLTKTTRANGSSTSKSYDADGNGASTTDGNGHITTNAYDLLNRLVSTTNPLSQVTAFSYDAAGNRTGLVDAAGRTTSFTFNADDELTAVAYSDGVTHGVTYGYDADGRRISMADGTGTTTYKYDSVGRLTSSTSGAGMTVGYAYNPAGDVTSITYPNGKTVTETYDQAGNLAAISDWLGHTTTFTYDRDANLTAEHIGSSKAVTDNFTYDAADNLLSINDLSSANKVLQGFKYTRNADNLVSAVTPSGKSAQTYTYDAAIRLTKDAQGSYTYDAAGNLTQLLKITPLAYNAAGELTSTGKTTAATTYGYDAEGDRTSVKPPSGSATAYTYDQAGRLTAFGKGTTTASYGYNGDGLRMSKTVGTTTSVYSWDTAAGTPLVLSDGAASYIYGPGGLPLESITTAGVATFYHHDQLGSTTMLTSAAGASVNTFTYDSHGVITTATTATPLLYAGQYRDAESGLYYLHARYYDPSSGQFISVDPALATTGQPYSYAGDDPIDGTDPSGLFSCFLGTNPNGSCRGSNVKNDAEVVGLIASAVGATVATGGVADVAFAVGFGSGLIVADVDCVQNPGSFSCMYDVVTTVAGAQLPGETGAIFGLVTGGLGIQFGFSYDGAPVTASGSAGGGLCGPLLPSNQPSLQGSSAQLQASNYQLQ